MAILAWPRARSVRTTSDYVRYETPEYRDATALRDRAATRIPAFIRALLHLPLVRSPAGLRFVSKLLHTVERAIPTDTWIETLIAAQKPDVVLVTPLVDIGSDQVEYVKAARALGIHSALCVHSWDNLTNKGLIRVLPDRVFVWNDAQKREAVTMHGMPPDHVVATGATVYDQWFAKPPTTTRAGFCAKTGLDAAKPFFLYLCSSQFIAPDESEFIANWIHAVRTAPDPRVREAGHPDPAAPGERAAVAALRFGEGELTNVALWPRGGANPIDRATKDDYFDSMYHSVAAVGINTSAQIESGIVGRPVFSVRVPDTRGPRKARCTSTSCSTRAAACCTWRRRSTSTPRSWRVHSIAPRRIGSVCAASFEAFVRPHGLDVDATPLLADAIHELAASRSRRPSGRRWSLPRPRRPVSRLASR